MPKFNSKGQFKNYEHMVSVLGAEQTFKDACLGYGVRMYRKERNIEQAEKLERADAMEKDPKYAQLIKELDAKLAAKKKAG